MLQKVNIVFPIIILAASAAFGQLPHLNSDQSYLKNYLYNEQSVNDKVENLKEFSTINDVTLPKKYRPESNQNFDLDTYIIPSSDLVIINTNGKIPEQLVGQNHEVESYNFFIHPLSRDFFAPYLKDYPLNSQVAKATATSSYRSVLVWNKEGPSKNKIFNLKISLDAEIGSTRRVLSRGQIERASATSLALKITDLNKYQKSGIHFINEPFSVYLKKFEYGYSYRELPHLQADEEIIPLFSLYATKNRPKSMLQNLIEKSGQGYREFVSENIIIPLTLHMLEMYFQDGLIPEPHEQNVCIKLKNGKLTKEFYYRDLAGFHFDPEARRSAGKSMNFLPANFKIESLKLGRVDLISNIQSYLLNSNFYALRSALESQSVSKQWIEETVLKTITTELLKQTHMNINKNNASRSQIWTNAKSALTKYKNQIRFSCQQIFGR